MKDANNLTARVGASSRAQYIRSLGLQVSLQVRQKRVGESGSRRRREHVTKRSQVQAVSRDEYVGAADSVGWQ